MDSELRIDDDTLELPLSSSSRWDDPKRNNQPEREVGMLWRGPHGGGAASGKFGTMVAAHNRAGQYIRARTTPTNPRTAQQSAVRNAIRSLAARWTSTLTQFQRDQWEVYAGNVARVNRLGDGFFSAGITWYMGNNAPRLQAGLLSIDDAPVVYDRGDMGSPTPIISFGALTTSATLTLQDVTPDWVGDTASSMLVYASRPFNAAINFFNGPYQLAIASPMSANQLAFTLPFAAGPVDSQIGFKLRVTRGDGRLTSAVQDIFLGS